MYSQDPKVRRRRIKLRYFAYGFMTIATLLLAVVSLFYVLGYRVDKSFEIQRGGLAKFDSRPQDADVSLNGRIIEQTPYQMNLPVGEHDISYARQGYQGWQKTINMRAGEVLWLNYARLIPESITTSEQKQLQAVHQTTASPNRDWYVIHERPDQPRFIVMDVSNEDNISDEVIDLPAPSFEAPPEGQSSTFNVIAWSRSSDFFMVQHRTREAREFIRVPVEDPAEAVNLSSLFDVTLEQVEFASNNPNIIFGLDSDGTLRRFDMNDAANHTVIADNVSSFDSLDDSQVAIIADKDTIPGQNDEAKPVARALQVWESGGRITTLSTVPANVAARVSYNPYLTQDYLSLITDNAMTVMQDPLGNAKKTVLTDTLGFSPASLSASPGNRFFLAQNQNQLYIYDVELGRSFNIAAPKETRQPVQWADDHHLALSGGGNLRLVEFDGMNAQFITSVTGSHDVIIGPEGKLLLSIGQDGSGRPVVQQSPLLTEADL